jgi:hypothetical protein
LVGDCTQAGEHGQVAPSINNRESQINNKSPFKDLPINNALKGCADEREHASEVEHREPGHERDTTGQLQAQAF